MIFAILTKIAVFFGGNGPCLSLSRKNMNILRESRFVRKNIGDSRLRKQMCFDVGG